MFKREAFVVDAHEVHDRGLEIVYVHRIFYDFVSDVVGFAERGAGSNAATGHPVSEAARVAGVEGEEAPARMEAKAIGRLATAGGEAEAMAGRGRACRTDAG